MVSTKTTVLSVRLPNETAEVIRKLAEFIGTTPSQMMVHILNDWLERERASKSEERK